MSSPTVPDPLRTPPHSPLRIVALFGREFTRSVALRKQVLAACLTVAAGLVEGVGVALIAPLVTVLAGSQQPLGRIEAWFAGLFHLIGLQLQLPAVVAALVALLACRAALVAGRDIVLADLRLEFIERLRLRLYDAITRADWPFLAKQRLSNLHKALTADVECVAHGTQLFLQIPASATIVCVQIGIAAGLAPVLTVVAVTCSCVLAILVWYWGGNIYHKGQQFAAAHGAAYDEMSDCLAALKLAKSHRTEERHRLRLADATARQRNLSLDIARTQAQSRMLVQLGAAAALGAFIYVGSATTTLRASELVVLGLIFARLLPFVAELQHAPRFLIHMLPVFDELAALIRRCDDAREQTPLGHTERLPLRDELRLADVRFRYVDSCGEHLLDGLDLTIPAGSVVALVGMSGAGKSTLADLIAGLIAPSAGSILVDGAPLAGPRLAAWRRSVAYVQQDSFLFNQTVRANLTWMAPDASEQDIRAALVSTGADKVVAGMPAGLDTPVGERGIRLSGGERQRLAIARALLRRPTLLILDEATSALDEQSERAMWDVIERLRGTMTVLVIAHRPSALEKADLIARLEHGRIFPTGGDTCSASGARQGHPDAFGTSSLS